MAVSTDNAFSGPYLTNGVTTVFPFTFTAPSAGEVSVLLRDPLGVENPASGYTVALVDGGGGSVAFAAPPVAGYSLLVLLDTLFTQDIAFENGSAWRAEPVNEGYDRSALRDQVLLREAGRALKAPIGETGLEVRDIAEGQVLVRIGDSLVGVKNDPAGSEQSALRAEAARAEAVEARNESVIASTSSEQDRVLSETAATRSEAAAQNALNYGNAAIRYNYVAADAETWAVGAWVQVLSSDTGTHTPKAGDYNPGGGNTPNAGVYQEDATLGLVRKAATTDQLAAEEADRAETAADSAEESAALVPAIQQQLDRWQVVVYSFDKPILNVALGWVRYPELIIGRANTAYRRIRPSDYGLTYFELPLSAGGDVIQHYIEVAAIGTSTNPLKSVVGGLYAEDLTRIPVGYSAFNQYHSFVAQDFIDAANPSHALVGINGPNWVYDVAGVAGPANSIYIYPGIPIFDFELGLTLGVVSNAANVSTGPYAGYHRLTRSAPGTAEALMFNATTGAVSIVGFGAVGAALAANPGQVRILATWYGTMLSTALTFDVPQTTGASDDLVARDARNLARSEALQARRVTWVQKATCSYNAMIVHGQSLSVGQETWPALSKVPLYGNKMLGTVVHSANTPSPDFTKNYNPFGNNAFNDLRSVVTDGGRLNILTDAQAAALPAGDAAYGEVPAVGWTNAAKFLHNQSHGVANDETRTFVAASVGLSGNAIETFTANGQFYKNGALTSSFFTFWPRFPDLISKLKTAAGAQTICIISMKWMQGENNAIPGFDGASSLQVDYKLNLNKVVDDHQSAVAATFADQALPFAFLTYQTGGSYTRDADENGTPGMAVAMAQLEVANERSDTWMVGPAYPVTDKGGHLDSNGSRWFAEQCAKVHDRVVNQGLDWSPVQPTRITQSGTTILIDYHVPCPPLVFDRPYVVSAATDIADKGFRVTDDQGAVPISSVALAGDTIVRIALGRETVGTVHVWYASEAHGGYGMLRDSDPSVATTRYEYQAGTGMYPAANIAALNGKPYPLWNWAVGSYLPVGFGL